MGKKPPRAGRGPLGEVKWARREHIIKGWREQSGFNHASLFEFSQLLQGRRDMFLDRNNGESHRQLASEIRMMDTFREVLLASWESTFGP